MPEPAGRYLPLSLPRRFVGDLVHFAKKVPTVPVQRRMSLASVVAARQGANPRPSWCIIFAKAFAIVAANRPELRRAYLSFPWPRLYEHPFSVASVGIERRLGDEDAVFFGHVRRPEMQTLRELHAHVRRFKDEPIERIGTFRRALKISRLPRPLRRFMWWFGLNTSGTRRAHYMGTFGISVYANLGAAALHQLSPLTAALTYGVFGDDGMIDVRLTYDHRVLDGGTVARALDDLEQSLKGPIVDELRSLPSRGKPSRRIKKARKSAIEPALVAHDSDQVESPVTQDV